MGLPSKDFLRSQILERVRGISPEERSTRSVALRTILLEQAVWQEARSVLFFAPLAGEPDIAALFEVAWREGKLVAFPRFEPATATYLAALAGCQADLVRGRFGVLEPGPGCPGRALNQLDLVLVPGVAFDPAGGRVGRGKGFYDRLLAGVVGHKCGVAFTEQIVAQVPVEPHDMRLDSILTPTRWIPCRRAA